MNDHCPSANSEHPPVDMDGASTLSAALLHLVLYIVMCLVYIWSPFIDLYGYSGFSLKFSPVNACISTVAILFVSFMAGTSAKSGTVLLHLGIAVMLSPMLVLSTCADLSISLLGITVFSFVLMVLVTQIPSVTSSPRAVKGVSLTLGSHVALSMCAAWVLLMLFSGQMQYFNLDTSEVYAYRRLDRDISVVYTYINPALSKVVVPFIVVYGVVCRRPIYIVTGIAMGMLMFGFTSHKSMALYPVVVYVICQALRLGSLWAFRMVMILLIGVVVLSGLSFYAEYAYERGGMFGSLFFRRALLIPSLLNAMYYEFFEFGPHYYFSHNTFTLGMIPAPYDTSPPFLIGAAYYGKTDASANAGFIGAGMAQMGVWGIVLYALVIGAVLRWLNSVSQTIGVIPALSLSVFPVIAMMTSSDLPTSLVTHGLWLTIVIFAVVEFPLPSDSNNLKTELGENATQCKSAT